MSAAIPAIDDDDVSELPCAVADSIASWRRVLSHASNGNAAALLLNAASDLFRTRAVGKTVWPASDGITIQAIVDGLHDMAVMAGISDDEAQAIFARAQREAAAPREPAPGERADDSAPTEEAPPPGGREDYGERQAEPATRPFVAPPLSIADWLSRDLPAPDPIMGDWLTTTTRGLLVGPTGLGKTNLALGLAMHTAAGVGFLHWRGRRPCKVLYIDGEMARRLFRQRIEDAVGRLGYKPEGFHALSHEDVEGFAPLNTLAGQTYVEQLIKHIGKPDLIVFDSIMCLLAGDMKDVEAWSQVMAWVRSLTRRCIGQLWLHHTGHDETRSYGDKTKEWQLDTVTHMEAVAREGADISFSLEFRKARERMPATRADFQTARIALVADEWTVEATGIVRAAHISPLGLKFLGALQNALASDGATGRERHRRVSGDLWRAECVAMGLIEGGHPLPAPSRSLFSKHKRELISANRVACSEQDAWIIA